MGERKCGTWGVRGSRDEIEKFKSYDRLDEGKRRHHVFISSRSSSWGSSFIDDITHTTLINQPHHLSATLIPPTPI